MPTNIITNIITGVVVFLITSFLMLIFTATIKKETVITAIKAMYSFKVARYVFAIALLVANWLLVPFGKGFVVLCCILFACIVLMICKDYLLKLFVNVANSDTIDGQRDIELQELAKLIREHAMCDPLERFAKQEEIRHKINSIRKKP